MLKRVFTLFLFVTMAIDAEKVTQLEIRAADMSSLAVEDCAMGCNRFRASTTGPTLDALVILAESNFNTVRLRVWVNPLANHSEGNVTYVVALAKRAKAAGLSVWVDFHLSDWWADPGHQFKPSLWANLSFNDLLSAVHTHVFSVLTQITAVADVVLVQVGNEITPGALWPEIGQPCSDSGAIDTQNSQSCSKNWPHFVELIATGISAARMVVPSARIAIHTDLGNRGIHAASDIIWWYTNFIAALPTGINFDVIALSYYMEWDALGPKGESSLATSVKASFPTKEILMAETSYAWDGNTPPTPNDYPTTPAGQLAFWQDTISNASSSGWLGVSWWGAEYAGDWTSLFDSNYVALPALLEGFQGTNFS